MSFNEFCANKNADRWQFLVSPTTTVVIIAATHEDLREYFGLGETLEKAWLNLHEKIKEIS